MKTHAPWAATASRLAVALLLSAPAAGAADKPPLPIVLALEDQANEIWSALPEDPQDRRVTVLGRTPRACAAEALRQGRGALERGQAGRLALRTLAFNLSVPRPVLAAAGTANPGDVADLFGVYAQSSSEEDFVARARRGRDRTTPEAKAGEAGLHSLYVQLAAARSDQALQPLLGGGCGPGAAVYDLRALPDRPGRLHLQMLVEVGCPCLGPAAGPGARRFRILGQAELEPGDRSFDGKKVTVRWRAKEPRYFVLASCRSCQDRPEEPRTELARTGAGPCGEPCAALGQGLAAWQDEATRARSQIGTLAEETAGLEAKLKGQRQELESAQAAKRKPRAVLDRITALQQDVKATQAELQRLAGAVEEVRERAGEVQRAADQAREADGQCQSQCQARQAERTPENAGGSGAAGATAGAAGGGGLGPGTLIVGGLVAGAGVAGTLALTNGGDEPAGGGFEGTWSGTRMIRTIMAPTSTVCTRRYSTVWTITRTGQSLRAGTTDTAQGCFEEPACGTGCQVFPFPWVHEGTIEGPTTARFLFREYTHSTCVLPMRMQGDTLSGTMTACQDGPHQMIQELNLRRMRQ